VRLVLVEGVGGVGVCVGEVACWFFFGLLGGVGWVCGCGGGLLPGGGGVFLVGVGFLWGAVVCFCDPVTHGSSRLPALISRACLCKVTKWTASTLLVFDSCMSRSAFVLDDGRTCPFRLREEVLHSMCFAQCTVLMVAFIGSGLRCVFLSFGLCVLGCPPCTAGVMSWVCLCCAVCCWSRLPCCVPPLLC